MLRDVSFAMCCMFDVVRCVLGVVRAVLCNERVVLRVVSCFALHDMRCVACCVESSVMLRCDVYCVLCVAYCAVCCVLC